MSSLFAGEDPVVEVTHLLAVRYLTREFIDQPTISPYTHSHSLE